jgi:endo-1,4-beta-mannosidase
MNGVHSARTYRFGLNYVPSKRWYYCWNDWNASEIAEDLDAIAALGVDHLRVMVIWPFFQPNPTYVSDAHLARLKELMELARERNLDVFLSPLTGWLSGFRLLPPNVEPEAIFRSETILEQEIRYFEALTKIAATHDNFLGFDLGNEINVLAQELPLSVGDAWGEKITKALRLQVPGKWIVNGVDHHPWFTGRTFSPQHLVTAYDAVSIHAWSKFTSCLERGGLADPPSLNLSAFLTHLCRHLMARAGVSKPVWIQEFGCSDLWGDESSKAIYMRQSIVRAIQAGATWFTWWCSHDVERRYRFDPLEYDLGLFTTGNQAKPLAGVYRELIQEYASAPVITPLPSNEALPEIEADFSPMTLKRLPPEEEANQPLETTTWRLFDNYLARMANPS